MVLRRKSGGPRGGLSPPGLDPGHLPLQQYSSCGRPDQLGLPGKDHLAKGAPLLVKQLIADGLDRTQHDHGTPLSNPITLRPAAPD